MTKRERDTGFEGWGGYMNAKVNKLDDQFSKEAVNLCLKEDNLFDGISIFVNGYTVPPAYELRNLMQKHGGAFHHYHRADKTTYIVASNLPDSKLKQVSRLTVIKPEWVTDCIKAGRLLNHKDYLLYTNHSKNQPILQFDKVKTTDVCMTTKTAKDDRFLVEFYNNSRLHLISTMGTTFKQYVNELRGCIKEFPGKESLLQRMKLDKETEEADKVSGWGTIIMHIDMDCFFVSVSILQRPDMVGKPVAVTHSKGNTPTARPGVNVLAEYKAYQGSKSSNPNHWSNAGQSFSMSEVASCSYEARKAGVKNGMFMGQALALCPSLVTLPYDFEGYKRVAKVLYDTVANYTLNIEAVSCDEMFVDCTELLSSVSMTPLEFATVLRNEIKEKTQCPCSTGFGANKLQARLATRKAKPNGQFFLEPDMVIDFMSSIPVSDLPGVGRSATYKLKSMGVTMCSDLQKLSLSSLKTEFGKKFSETLYNFAYGRDCKTLTFEKIRKSVSAEVNYGIRFQEDAERDKFLKQLSEEVSKRLMEVSMKGKSITLKIMVKSKDAPEETAKFLGHGVCDYVTKTNSLRSHTNDPALIQREVNSILSQLNIPSKDLRGIGIQISKLISEKCAKNNLNKFFFTNKNYGKDDSDGSETIKTPDKLRYNSNMETPVQSENPLVINEESKKKDNLISHESELFENTKNMRKNVGNGNNKTKPLLGMNKMPETGGRKSYKRQRALKEKPAPNNVQPDLHDISISQIDPSFLEALPEELRSEILGAVKKCDKVPGEDPQTVENHLLGGRSSSCIESSTEDNTNSDNLWGQISVTDMRSLIKDWVDSCDSPHQRDVAVFSSYLTTLVSTRKIDQLHILLKTFLRYLKKSEKSFEWMSAFNIAHEEVQNRMLAVYGSKLIQII